MDAFDDLSNEERRLLRLHMEEEWTTCGTCGKIPEARVNWALVAVVMWLLTMGLMFKSID